MTVTELLGITLTAVFETVLTTAVLVIALSANIEFAFAGAGPIGDIVIKRQKAAVTARCIKDV